ncbi:MAG: hypothetical protein ACLGIN_17105, partial [Candidatus Sericytochromatia bacterium]
MTTALDRYLTPPESNVPEIDGDDEERLVLEILSGELYKAFGHLVCYRPALDLLAKKLKADDALHEAFVNHYREQIDEAWAEEHTPDEGAKA